jgi:hypothetical protein
MYILEGIHYHYDVCSKAFINIGNLQVHHCVRTGVHPCLCDLCYKTIGKKCVPVRYLLSYFYQDQKSCDMLKPFIMVHCFQDHHCLQLWWHSVGSLKMYFYCALM